MKLVREFVVIIQYALISGYKYESNKVIERFAKNTLVVLKGFINWIMSSSQHLRKPSTCYSDFDVLKMPDSEML